MKTLSALIFCISVILLVYLSGALNKDDRYLLTQQEVVLYESVECMQECAEAVIVTTLPAQQTVKLLARLKGQSKTVVRVEYQDMAGWFEATPENSQILNQ